MQFASLFSRTTLLVIFFSLQLIGIGAGLLTDAKYFNWVPYDQLSRYEIQVDLPTGPLPPSEIYERYGRSTPGRENRNIHNLITILRRYETTRGKTDSASVTLNYTINGHNHGQWTWPKLTD